MDVAAQLQTNGMLKRRYYAAPILLAVLGLYICRTTFPGHYETQILIRSVGIVVGAVSMIASVLLTILGIDWLRRPQTNRVILIKNRWTVALGALPLLYCLFALGTFLAMAYSGTFC